MILAPAGILNFGNAIYENFLNSEWLGFIHLWNKHEENMSLLLINLSGWKLF